MINPTTHAITEFPVPTANADPSGITAGPDGNLWFTELTVGKIGMINPTTHAISRVRHPHAVPSPAAITAGPDGNLWFTEIPRQAKIGEINPATHAITEYPIPYASSESRRDHGRAPTATSGSPIAATDSIGLATLPTTSLVVTQQPPSSVAAGSPFGLTVEAENSSGNLVTSFNGTVTVAMANYPAAPRWAAR